MLHTTLCVSLRPGLLKVWFLCSKMRKRKGKTVGIRVACMCDWFLFSLPSEKKLEQKLNWTEKKNTMYFWMGNINIHCVLCDLKQTFFWYRCAYKDHINTENCDQHMRVASDHSTKIHLKRRKHEIIAVPVEFMYW